MPLCASVYMCLVVTCWERADLLAPTVSLSISHWYPWSGVVLDDLCTLTYFHMHKGAGVRFADFISFFLNNL